jgi:hypothetical protein
MDDLARLLAIEGVRRTKAEYWYAVDMKDRALLASVFTDDALMDVRQDAGFAQGGGKALPPPLSPDVPLDPADPAVMGPGGGVIAGWIADVLADVLTVHHGHAPVIEIEDADNARAIWPMFDYIDNRAGSSLKGYGHYHERYRRVGQRWLIAESRLTRIRLDGRHPLGA